MALLQCTWFAQSLGMTADLYVALPEAVNTQADHPAFPVLYLLHGGSDNHTNWLRYTGIERYAAEHNLMVVMPAAALSFYTDMAYGQAYYTYISEELPRFVQSTFPAARTREETYIAGLSMGGYGALRIGLANPDRYAAVGSFSGVTDIRARAKRADMTERSPFRAVFGDAPVADADDPAWLAQQLMQPGRNRPALMVTCGTEDFLFEDNIAFTQKLDEMGFSHTWLSWPGGHTWDFWDESIRRFLDALPGRTAAQPHTGNGKGGAGAWH